MSVTNWFVMALFASVALGQSASVRGVVRDSNARPVAAATVSLGNGLTVLTDADGKYAFPALPASTYTLRAEIAGFAAAQFGPFSIAEKETKQVDLTLVPRSAEFFDEPSFVVAGVTDMVNQGGHGSETAVRSTEALTRAAAALGTEPVATLSEESLRKAIEKGPANADLHHSLADAYEKSGKALEAVREYQRAAALNAAERNLFDWGTELLTHRAAEPAIEVFVKGHRLFPGSARMLLGLGAAHYAHGSYGEAARRFFEAADLDPRDPEPYLFLGKVENAEIVHMSGYVERLARFARLQPENALANYSYAVGLWRNRAPAEQVEPLLEKSLRLDPALGDAYLELGMVYSSRQDFAKAIASLKKAIDVGTKNAEAAHYRLAQAYRQIGDQVNARKEFNLFEQLRKTSAEEDERQRNQIQQFVFRLRDR